MLDPEDPEAGGGYDAEDWRRLAAFSGRPARLDDVQARQAVFALEDTRNARCMDLELPQPVIWWSDEGALGAVAVQAEIHDQDEGEPLEVLGLILPDGGASVALLEDCDLVDEADPVWRDLVERAVEDEGEAQD